jgi:hypothetical protein
MADDEDREAEDDGAAEGHHDLVAQPHSDDEGPIAEAEILAVEMSSDEQPPRFTRTALQSTFAVLHRGWRRSAGSRRRTDAAPLSAPAAR